MRFASDGSTGGFRPDAASQPAADLTVAELLASVDGDVVVWKSDTDGLDVALLADAWPVLDARCAVVWFELDPALDVEHGRRIPELMADIARSGRTALVYDNTGRFVARLPATDSTRGGRSTSCSRHPFGTARIDS